MFDPEERDWHEISRRVEIRREQKRRHFEAILLFFVIVAVVFVPLIAWDVHRIARTSERHYELYQKLAESPPPLPEPPQPEPPPAWWLSEIYENAPILVGVFILFSVFLWPREIAAFLMERFGLLKRIPEKAIVGVVLVAMLASLWAWLEFLAESARAAIAARGHILVFLATLSLTLKVWEIGNNKVREGRSAAWPWLASLMWLLFVGGLFLLYCKSRYAWNAPWGRAWPLIGSGLDRDMFRFDDGIAHALLAIGCIVIVVTNLYTRARRREMGIDGR